MSRLEIILCASLFVSAILNVGIFAYARKAVSILMNASEELGDLQLMINSFTNHITGLYEMEMYYGDETLRGLMQHANSFADQMENFEHIYSLSEMPAIETANDEDAGENEEAEQ